MAKPYWDEDRQRWMIDDHGKPREATPEEVEFYLEYTGERR
jgi:hypothetical protein